eukprot:scaffold1315_cov405-Prasinococcus_capsulatus_cf.AAC.12
MSRLRGLGFILRRVARGGCEGGLAALATSNSDSAPRASGEGNGGRPPTGAAAGRWRRDCCAIDLRPSLCWKGVGSISTSRQLGGAGTTSVETASVASRPQRGYLLSENTTTGNSWVGAP